MLVLLEDLAALWSAVPLSSRIVYVGWAIYLSMYLFFYRYEKHNKITKARVIKKRNQPYTFYALLIATIIVDYHSNKSGAFSDFSVFKDNVAEFEILFQWGGFLFMLLGLFTVVEARARLNGFWGGAIFEYTKKDDNYLVTEGIYSWLRHPIYFGQVLMAFGTAIMFNNYIAFLFPIMGLISNYVRANAEDNDLGERFGESFESYKNRTNGFVPWL